MSKPVSPPGWVQLLQGLVAHELVNGMGLSGRRAAELLGVSPSAISQYLSGRRLRTLFPAFTAREEARRIARRVAQRLVDLPAGRVPPPRLLLEAAAELAERTGEAPGARRTAGEDSPPPDPTLLRELRKRVVGEQSAVAYCMHLAQRARDELTREIFRQIALDSLRHAEIAASLITYLDRGMSSTYASGITRRDVEKLIEKEQAAEQGAQDFSKVLGGTMGLLAWSMEADEKKHDELLHGLLDSGFLKE